MVVADSPLSYCSVDLLLSHVALVPDQDPGDVGRDVVIVNLVHPVVQGVERGHDVHVVNKHHSVHISGQRDGKLTKTDFFNILPTCNSDALLTF